MREAEGALSTYLDVVPEAKAAGDVLHARTRHLVDPGRALEGLPSITTSEN